MYNWLIAQIGVDGARVVVVVAAFLVAALVVWLIISLSRRVQNRSANAEHKSRLALCVSMPVDAQRRLVIVRRDGVEHLLLIGGPSDVVVESKIPIASLSPVAHPVLADRHNELAHGVVDEDAVIGFSGENGARETIFTPAVMTQDNVPSNVIEQEEVLREAALREAVEQEEQAADQRKMETAAPPADEIQPDITQEVTAENQETEKQPEDMMSIPLSYSALSMSPLSSLPLSALASKQTAAEPLQPETQILPVQHIAAQHTAQDKPAGESVAQNSEPEAVTGVFSPAAQQKEAAPQEETGFVEPEPPFSSYFAGQPKQRTKAQTQAQVPPQTPEKNHGQAREQVQPHGQVARLMPMPTSPLSSPVAPVDVVQAAEEHEAGLGNVQNFSLNPFVRPPADRTPSPAVTQQKMVTHETAESSAPVESPASYANNFLGYPVQRFSDSAFPAAVTPQMGTTMAAGMTVGLAVGHAPIPMPPVSAVGEKVLAAPVPHLYPVDSTPPPQSEEALPPVQNLADDFEQMLHDELMRPVDDGLKIVSFKP